MRILASLIILLATLVCSSQEPIISSTNKSKKEIKISGLIVDSYTGQPLEYATIFLQSLENKNIVTGGITNKKGRFSTKISVGKFNLNIEHLSYKTFSLKNQELLKTTDLGIIEMVLETQQLDELELIGKKTTVELKLDKKTYNVGNNLTLAGGNASDALSNIPSVAIDADGTISLRGNSNVKILINGKPTTSSGLSPEALKEMPVTTIEKVEVITNPSSKYSSSGTAGILNIILRKNKSSGLNGSVSASIRDPKSNKLGANINIKRKNFNIFSNINFTHQERPGFSLFENTFYDELNNISGAEHENRLINKKSKNIHSTLGVELLIDETSSITNAINYSKINGDNNTILDITNFDKNKNPAIERNRNTQEDNYEENVSYSINYEKKINNKGHKLEADYQFSRSYEIEDRLITEFLKNDMTDNNLGIANTNDRQINQLLQFNYTLPFGRNQNSKIELGYRGDFDDYHIDYLEGSISNGIFSKDQKYSNILIYNQYVNAGYIQFIQNIRNFSFSTGLRTEHTNLTVNLTNSNRIDKSDYIDWFPSLFLKYDISAKEKISLSYTRRLTRPSAGSLNPFPNRVSKTNLFNGNPELTPMYTNSYEFNYFNKWKKITLTSSLFYTKTIDAINFVNIETGDFYSIEDPNNLGSLINIPIITKLKKNLPLENRYGLDLTTTFVPKKNWRFSINTYLYKQNIDSKYGYVNILNERITRKFKINQFRWFSRLNFKVPLPYRIGFQAIFNYSGPNKNSETKTKSLNRLNLAISKKIIKNKASITLGVRDVLNNFQRYSETNLSHSLSKNTLKSDMRYISLALNYKFNQKQ